MGNSYSYVYCGLYFKKIYFYKKIRITQNYVGQVLHS